MGGMMGETWACGCFVVITPKHKRPPLPSLPRRRWVDGVYGPSLALIRISLTVACETCLEDVLRYYITCVEKFEA